MRRTAWTVRRPTCWGRAGRHGKGAAGRSTSGCSAYLDAQGVDPAKGQRLVALLLRSCLARDLLKLGAERRLRALCCAHASDQLKRPDAAAEAARGRGRRARVDPPPVSHTSFLDCAYRTSSTRFWTLSFL